MIKEHPVIFSTPMVQAILEGIKSQTRRIVQSQPVVDKESGYTYLKNYKLQLDIHNWKVEILNYCPYGKIGDTLWVRESFAVEGHTTKYYIYKADEGIEVPFFDFDQKWKPSIHMPRTAARILLKIENIRVEHVQEISATDCISEGIERLDDRTSDVTVIGRFQNLWDKINIKRAPWENNPWVWVITFSLQTKTSL